MYNDIFNHGIEPEVIGNTDRIYGIGSGYRFQLQMLLDFDRHYIKNPYLEQMSEASFDIAMNSYEDPFAVFFTKSVLKAGYKNQFKMTPLISSATEALRAVAREKRGCLFPEENGGIKMFTYVKLS